MSLAGESSREEREGGHRGCGIGLAEVWRPQQCTLMLGTAGISSLETGPERALKSAHEVKVQPVPPTCNLALRPCMTLDVSFCHLKLCWMGSSSVLSNSTGLSGSGATEVSQREAGQ